MPVGPVVALHRHIPLVYTAVSHWRSVNHMITKLPKLLNGAGVTGWQPSCAGAAAKQLNIFFSLKEILILYLFVLTDRKLHFSITLYDNEPFKVVCRSCTDINKLQIIRLLCIY